MNPYEVLGLQPDATLEQVKAAFRREASRTHPDKGGDGTRMAQVNEAYAILSDPARRRQFDETGNTREPASVDAEATEILAGIFTQALQQDAASVVDFAKGSLLQMRGNMKQQRTATLRRSRTLRAKRGKVKTKKDQPNLLHGIIDQQLVALGQSLVKIRHVQQVVKRALQLLESYDEDRPQQVIDPAWVMYQAGLGNAGSRTGGWFQR